MKFYFEKFLVLCQHLCICQMIERSKRHSGGYDGYDNSGGGYAGYGGYGGFANDRSDNSGSYDGHGYNSYGGGGGGCGFSCCGHKLVMFHDTYIHMEDMNN